MTTKVSPDTVIFSYTAADLQDMLVCSTQNDDAEVTPWIVEALRVAIREAVNDFVGEWLDN